MFKKIHLDIIELPLNNKRKYLVIIKDNFTQWPKARVLRDKSLKNITRFIQEDIIY